MVGREFIFDMILKKNKYSYVVILRNDGYVFNFFDSKIIIYVVWWFVLLWFIVIFIDDVLIVINVFLYFVLDWVLIFW